MNTFDSLFQTIQNKDADFLRDNSDILDKVEVFGKNIKAWLKKCNVEVVKCAKNGCKSDDVKKICSLLSQKPLFPTEGRRNSVKENVEPEPPKKTSDRSARSSRPKRTAFMEASQLINQQTNINLSDKLRRPDGDENIYSLTIKSEKLSLNLQKSQAAGKVPDEVVVKKEDMPAPTRLPPRKARTKKQIANQTVTVKIERDSDVLIENAPVPVINLTDSADETEQPVQNMRMTRTKTRQKQKKPAKRPRSKSSEADATDRSEKRSKSSSDPEGEAVQSAPKTSKEVPSSNATFTLDKVTEPQSKPIANDKPAMDATVVIQNPKFVKDNQGHSKIPDYVPDSLMTDDESEEDHVKTPAYAKPKAKPAKQVFSPFEPSPVKKKVEAFEKLNSENGDLPPRMTRTKTKAKAEAHKEEDNVDAAIEEPPIKIQNSFYNLPKSNVKEKAKIFTPITTKTHPKACSTTKIQRTIPSISATNESAASIKSASALKMSQAEYREKEKRRKEKEQEAQRKRDAMIQAQIEEKRRRREEKQLKAQQQREALEKEKLKALEVQKLKEERHKQLLAEQEEKKQKQREESEKKRNLAKMKALEEKKREEKERLEAQKKEEEMKAQLARQDEQMAKLAEKCKQQKGKRVVPPYMAARPPLLPTHDCYDSDDERYNPRVRPPAWAVDPARKTDLLVMMHAGEKIKNTFFSCQATTPDLQEIFEIIDSRLLKRASSACWQRPPEYSILSPLASGDEDDDDF